MSVFLKFSAVLLIVFIIPIKAQLIDQGIVTGSGGPAVSHTFYENAGVVSMEAEHASFISLWKPAAYAFDTRAMEADSAGTGRKGKLGFDIYFSQPGKYALWILARKGRQSNEKSDNVRVHLKDGVEVEITIPEHYYTWSSIVKGEPEPVWLEIKTPGLHQLEFITGDEWQIAIDKIMLSWNNTVQPQGRGPAETSKPDVDPLKKGFRPDIVLPPAWAFGILYGGYTNQQESLERVQAIIDHNYPIDAYWIDSWFWNFRNGGRGPEGYMDFKGDTTAFPAPGELWNEFQKRNVKAGIWVWDIINQTGNEKTFDEFEKAGAFEFVFHNKSGWHNYGAQSMAGQINFNDTNTVKYFQHRLKPFFDQGLDFLKLDRNPGVPFARACFDATRMSRETKGRGFIMQHVGDLADPDHVKYPTKWTGDSEIAWTLPNFPNAANSTMGGLTQNIEMVAWPKRFQYEVPFLTHDGGGFRIINCPDFGEELFMRWIQFSLFNTITEVFQSLYNSSGNLAWQFSPRADSMYRKYSHLRMMLFPYIYSYAHKTRLTGEKMIRGDGVHKYQYLFGNEILVAPVCEKGATSKTVFLPGGEWINYYTGEVYPGNTEITAAAPLERIPLFVRSGAIIPMRDYARSIETGNNRHITLAIYPADSSRFTMYEDDGLSNDYMDGMYASTTFTCNSTGKNIVIGIGASRGNYAGMTEQRKYSLVMTLSNAPAAINIDGKKIKPRTKSDKRTGYVYCSNKKELRIILHTSTLKGHTVYIEK